MLYSYLNSPNASVIDSVSIPPFPNVKKENQKEISFEQIGLKIKSHISRKTQDYKKIYSHLKATS